MTYFLESKQRFIPEYMGCEIWLRDLRIEIKPYSQYDTSEQGLLNFMILLWK